MGYVSPSGTVCLACFAAIGCAAYSTGPNPPVALPPDAVQERPPEEVRIYTTTEMPTRPYLERGTLKLADPTTDKRANLDRLRKEAGERACDGVILANEEVTSGTCIVYSAAAPIGDPAAAGEPQGTPY